MMKDKSGSVKAQTRDDDCPAIRLLSSAHKPMLIALVL